MKHLKEEIRLTDHFVERYFERVLNRLPSKLHSGSRTGQKDMIINDLDNRIIQRDKSNLLFLKDSNKVRVPFEQNQIVMSKGVFITVLS